MDPPHALAELPDVRYDTKSLLEKFPLGKLVALGVSNIANYGRTKLLLERLRPSEGFLIVFSVVTLAFSQVLYNLILNNSKHFPDNGPFFVYVIVAVQVIPVAVVFTVDIVLGKLFGIGLVARLWRASLYLFVFLAVLRQAQLSEGIFRDWLVQLQNQPVLAVVIFLVLSALCLGATRAMTLFFKYLAALALVLTGIFFFQTGLYGPAWVGQAAKEAPDLGLSQSPNVFIIIFDELSYEALVENERVDQQSFPNFAALSADSVWFTRATTNFPDTNPSIETFVTGTLADTEESKTASTIFQRLGRNYEINLYEEKASLARRFGDQHSAFNRRGYVYARTHFPIETGKWALLEALRLLTPIRVWEYIGYVPNDYTPELNRLLDDVSASKDSGYLYYWHTMVPHFPYVFNADGTRHKATNASFLDPSADPAAVFVNYRKQVQFVDKILGDFVQKLKTENLYDTSVIVITADHGLGAGPLTSRLHVPMIIRAPGLEPRWTDIEYQHVDFVPTLLEVLNIPLEPDHGLSGISVFGRRTVAPPSQEPAN